MNDDSQFDMVRRAALRWPIWLQLDEVATEQDPLLRCVVVAKALGPLRRDESVGDEVVETIAALRAEALHRRDGTRPAVPALVAPPKPASEPGSSKEKTVA